MGNVADECNCILSILKYLVMIICSALGAGPLLSLTIQQVCISKCLLLRRLPIMGGANADDLLIIFLYCFYAVFNYTMISLFWSISSKSLQAIITNCNKVSTSCCVDRCAPLEPKETTSGSVYACSKADRQDDNKPGKAKKSTCQFIRV